MTFRPSYEKSAEVVVLHRDEVRRVLQLESEICRVYSPLATCDRAA